MTVRDLCLVEPCPRGGDPADDLVERYIEFVAARCRPNTVAATRSDLGVFFSVVDKPPDEVMASDVLEFIAVQRRPRGDGKVVRHADEAGAVACRWCARPARCPRCSTPARSTPCWGRCAGGGTGRWWRRWCSVGCAAARRWAYACAASKRTPS